MVLLQFKHLQHEHHSIMDQSLPKELLRLPDGWGGIEVPQEVEEVSNRIQLKVTRPNPPAPPCTTQQTSHETSVKAMHMYFSHAVL